MGRRASPSSCVCTCNGRTCTWCVHHTTSCECGGAMAPLHDVRSKGMHLDYGRACQPGRVHGWFRCMYGLHAWRLRIHLMCNLSRAASTQSLTPDGQG